MSLTARRRNRDARKARSRESREEWLRRFYAPGGGNEGRGASPVRGMRYWALRNPAGEVRSIAACRSSALLAWEIRPGWTTRELAGGDFDRHRLRGIVPLDGKTLRPATGLNPPRPLGP